VLFHLKELQEITEVHMKRWILISELERLSVLKEIEILIEFGERWTLSQKLPMKRRRFYPPA